MSHTFARRFAIAALSLPLLLAGCADDEPVPKVQEPTAAPTPVASTSASPAAPVEPTLPPEAEGKGIEAAEAFVRHYFELVDYAQATGDVAALNRISLDECDACRGGADAIRKIYREGGVITGGEHSVEKAEVTGRRAIPGYGFIYYANVRVSHTDQEIEGTKALDGDYGSGTNNLRFIVIRTTNWRVSKWYEL
jgi:hypothetical protein